MVDDPSEFRLALRACLTGEIGTFLELVLLRDGFFSGEKFFWLESALSGVKVYNFFSYSFLVSDWSGILERSIDLTIDFDFDLVDLEEAVDGRPDFFTASVLEGTNDFFILN